MKHTEKTTAKSIAYIFEDVGGFFICCDSLDYLDARGYAHRSKRAAIASARASGDWTHYRTSGRKPRKL